eukprot:s24_g32.t1
MYQRVAARFVQSACSTVFYRDACHDICQSYCVFFPEQEGGWQFLFTLTCLEAQDYPTDRVQGAKSPFGRWFRLVLPWHRVAVATGTMTKSPATASSKSSHIITSRSREPPVQADRWQQQGASLHTRSRDHLAFAR